MNKKKEKKKAHIHIQGGGDRPGGGRGALYYYIGTP
jgi:hypothetical protein